MTHSAWSILFGAIGLLPMCANADVVISSAQTWDVTCTGGLCAPTAADAVLNVNDLENLLASGNLEVTTTGGGGVQAGNIDVDAAASWSVTNTLSLDAYNSIAFSKTVSVKGSGGLSLVTNDGGGGGTLSFGLKGNVAFANLSSVLTINGMAYTLENSISALASAISANPGGNYALAADYDAAGDGTYNNTPIRTTVTGTVEGLGNTISKLSVKIVKGNNPLKQYGLFGELGRGGTIASLKMTGYKIDVPVHQGMFHVYYGAGGMVGLNAGLLFDDHASGVLHTKSGGGGLVGQNAGTIANSSSDARVSGPTGGGGLVFDNYGEITESYATGAVSGGDNSIVGGLVAFDDGGVSNSYAAGEALGGSNSEVGGLDGSENAASSAYSAGHVKAAAGSRVGGFAGEGSNNTANCYWDTTTSGTDQGTGNDENTGITGLTDKQFKAGLPSGFDPTIWAESAKINNGLPYLIGNPPK
ncbi:MAG TPA: hypothetical protein VHY79_19235 [Rhizomicrobium sp.]|jgi:hypothetical protein|nr:hypothetical protein [Rhizomicrobium sp.]